MRSVDEKFYKTKAWKDCRATYLAEHSLCERCLAKGLIVPARFVHHKVYLTEDNVKDPSISLNHANLEALCHDCHNQEHFADKVEKRWNFDGEGNLSLIE